MGGLADVWTGAAVGWGEAIALLSAASPPVVVAMVQASTRPLSGEEDEMGDSTGIQWTDATWNPLRARHRETGAEGWACVRVSPGCINCYAATLNETRRWQRGTGLDYTVPALAQVETYLDEATLTQPLRWKKPRRVFVCSMTDLFGEWVTDEQLDRVFAVMALTPQHTYQVLTKRPERMRAWFEGVLADDEEQGYRADRINRATDTFDLWPDISEQGFPTTGEWPLPNVWLGVSVEDQERADERIPMLLDTSAAVRFLSCEPLLGPVDLSHHLFGGELSWVIVGGESGPGARPFSPSWARAIRDACRDQAGFFMKQMGSHVIERNDQGFDGDEPSEWPAGTRTEDVHRGHRYQGDPVRIKLRHNHGGDPDEWPEDLRVREWPAGAGVLG